MRKYKECYRCGRTTKVDMHHVFNSFNKKNSEKFGAVIPLCRECHEFYHHDEKEYRKLKAAFQLQIMGEWDMSIEEFREIFHKNYVDLGDDNEN